MKVTIVVDTSAAKVEASGEAAHSGVALIRAIEKWAEVTNDAKLHDIAKHVDQLGQREYGWPPAIGLAD